MDVTKTISMKITHVANWLLRVSSASTRVVAVDVRGHQIKISVSTQIEQYRVDTYTTKEPETLDWLDHSLMGNGEKVFFDIGANIGLYSLYAAQINPSCRVFAFEPEAQTFAVLCRNIVLNKATNIVPCSFPLSGKTAFDLFYVHDLEPGAAACALGGPCAFVSEPDKVILKQGAFSVTIDDLVGLYGVPLPDLMKIDVDGIEDQIIAGAATVLQSERLHTLLVELNYRSEADVARYIKEMREHGLYLSNQSQWVGEFRELKSQNFIFHRQ